MKKERINRNKIMNQCKTDEQHEALRSKISREKDLLLYQRDQQKVVAVMKQENRRLKEEDLKDLQTYQRRIKNRQKFLVASKKVKGDEIMNNEIALRDNFIKRVQ